MLSACIYFSMQCDTTCKSVISGSVFFSVQTLWNCSFKYSFADNCCSYILNCRVCFKWISQTDISELLFLTSNKPKVLYWLRWTFLTWSVPSRQSQYRYYRFSAWILFKWLWILFALYFSLNDKKEKGNKQTSLKFAELKNCLKRINVIFLPFHYCAVALLKRQGLFSKTCFDIHE